MRKGIIVAVATFAMGLTGLFATPAKGLQYGFNLGYSSVGFKLHGVSGEFVLGLQGKDEHRPQGSLLRIGAGGAWGRGATDLTKATWDGGSVAAFKTTVGPSAIAAARAGAIAATGGTATFNQLPPAQQALINAGIAASLFPGGATAFALVPDAQKPDAIAGIIASLSNTTLEQVLLEGYSIDDITDAKGNATAIFVTLAYEYVLAKGAPGLGFIVGGEVYISQGGYEGNTVTAGDTVTVFPSANTEGGIGGGGIIGVSYYLKNGLNFTLKTGLGVVDPGKVVYNIAGTSITVEPETVFYASPTFSVGYLY